MLLKGTIQSSDINTFQHVEFQRMEEAMAEFEEISNPLGLGIIV